MSDEDDTEVTDRTLVRMAKALTSHGPTVSDMLPRELRLQIMRYTAAATALEGVMQAVRNLAAVLDDSDRVMRRLQRIEDALGSVVNAEHENVRIELDRWEGFPHGDTPPTEEL